MKNYDRREVKYCPNRRKASLWIACAALILGIWLITNSAFSIPNCCGVGIIDPPNSWVPHEHSGIPVIGFPDGTVTFAVDADGDGVPNQRTDRELVVMGPDNHGHQHHDRDPFTDDTGRVPGRYDFSDDTLIWDNRSLRYDNNGNGIFDLGHGFIDEDQYGFGRQRQRPDMRPRYRFAANVPTDAQKVVNEAFAEWSSIASPNNDLFTGIEFVVTTGEEAEIEIQWRDIIPDGLICIVGRANDSECGATPGAGVQLWIVFDSVLLPGESWHFGGMAAIRNSKTERHFKSIALHELGHAVGLDHIDNWQDVMDVESNLPGCPTEKGMDANGDKRDDNFDNRFPCFDSLTQYTANPESIHGVIDMYSIPTPDFGDAPATYPTRLEDNGARAPTLAYEWLGPRPANGISTTTREENANIVNRDLNFEQDGDMFVEVPENGCDIKGVIPDSFANVTYTVSVNNPTSARYADDATRLYVAIWVDWNRNGTWTDESKDGRLPVAQGGVPNELLDLTDDSHFVNDTNPRLWTDDEKMQGFKTFSKKIRVPKEAKLGETWMRCRLVYGLEPKTDPPSRTGARTYLESPNQDSLVTHGDAGLVFLNASPDNGGEIEDHKVCIGQPRAVKLTSADYITAGEEITFTITLENTTLCDYEAVDVFDALSGFVTFGQILRAPPGVFYNPDRLAIDGQFSLASGETATIVYRVSVGDFVPSDSIIPNCVTLDGLSFRLERCTETIVIP